MVVRIEVMMEVEERVWERKTVEITREVMVVAPDIEDEDDSWT